MDKRFLIILSVVVLAVGGIIFFSHSKSNSKNNAAATGGSNHVIGNNTTGVALVEYGDYQCPACGQFFPIVKQIQQKYNDKISFQFANFPLVQIHQHAMLAARAAEAASLQDKFWEMHDLLYENQKAWGSASDPNEYFLLYAKQLGLNTEKFKTDMASTGVASTINADISKVQALGGTGTPTFVLNGKKIENPDSLEAFVKVIDDEIAKQAQQKK